MAGVAGSAVAVLATVGAVGVAVAAVAVGGLEVAGGVRGGDGSDLLKGE